MLGLAALGLGVGLGHAAEGEPRPGGGAGAPASTAPPLLIEDDAPPLLEEPAHATNGAALQVQHDTSINAACYVCHVNFKQDAFVQWHVKTNIGCVHCHGPSREHVADEANLTPPDVMYPPQNIALSCALCHPVHKANPREVLARWQEWCSNKADPYRVVCTDCHGDHRLKVRATIWHKKTGALLAKNKPRPRPEAPPAAPASPPKEPPGPSPDAEPSGQSK